MDYIQSDFNCLPDYFTCEHKRIINITKTWLWLKKKNVNFDLVDKWIFLWKYIDILMWLLFNMGFSNMVVPYDYSLILFNRC